MVKIRIIPVGLEKDLNSKSLFWSYLSKVAEKSNDPEKLEYFFRKQFAKELKENLRKKFQNELSRFEREYGIYPDRFLDEFFFRGSEKDKRYQFDDFVNGITKLQELKNEFFKNNKEYQNLFAKSIIASLIDFQIDNISYSSLGFDLSTEPLEKAVELFDNNFEYFRIFLDQYISESFLSSFSIYYDRLPIDVSINYSDDFKKEFEKTAKSKMQQVDNVNSVNEQNTGKLEKAKWIWSLANGSLIVPVILALIILFVTFDKMDSIFKIRQDNYKEMQLENEKILENYKELMKFQKETYNSLVDKIKNEKIK